MLNENEKLVKIEWIDAVTKYKTPLENFENFGLIQSISIGYLLKNNKNFVLVSNNLDDAGCGDITIIPKCLIKKIWFLEEKKSDKNE